MDLSLAPDQTYVFFLSASEYFDGLESGVMMAGNPIDAYPIGSAVYLNNGNDTSQWTGQDWHVFSLSWDLVFRADFLPVPEPSSAEMLLMGAGMFYLRFRRQSRING